MDVTKKYVSFCVPLTVLETSGCLLLYSPIIPLVFNYQPKALVCDKGCHLMITNSTPENMPVDA
jgi:hypothetical protein